MKSIGYRPITDESQIGKMNPVTPEMPKFDFDQS